MFEIKFPSGSAPGPIYLGRNRYGKQAGIAVVNRSSEGQRIVRLYPITTRNTVSDACHMDVPAEAISELIDALQTSLNEWPGDARSVRFADSTGRIKGGAPDNEPDHVQP